jgi:hypothetical protein
VQEQSVANLGSHEIKNYRVPASVIKQLHTDVVKVTGYKRENRAGVTGEHKCQGNKTPAEKKKKRVSRELRSYTLLRTE